MRRVVAAIAFRVIRAPRVLRTAMDEVFEQPTRCLVRTTVSADRRADPLPNYG